MKIQMGEEYRSEEYGEVVQFVCERSVWILQVDMARWLEALRRFAYPKLQPRPVISIAGLTMV